MNIPSKLLSIPVFRKGIYVFGLIIGIPLITLTSAEAQKVAAEAPEIQNALPQATPKGSSSQGTLTDGSAKPKFQESPTNKINPKAPNTLKLGNETPTQNTQEREGLVPNVDRSLSDQPFPNEIIVNPPEFIITGYPIPSVIIVDVPQFTITGFPIPPTIVVDVPTFIITAQDEDRDDVKTKIGVVPGARKSSDGSTETTNEERTTKLWCFGDYTAHIGRGLGTAVGVSMPFGRTMEVPASVKSKPCDETISVNIQGRSVNMTRTEDLRTYVGSINLGDGADRLLVLRCDEDFSMRGKLAAKDANLKIERPVWLLLKGKPEELTCKK